MRIVIYSKDGTLKANQPSGVPVTEGGTGSNLGATGPGVVIQASTGAALSVETSLDAVRGGTEQTTVTAGDLLVGSGANAWGKLAIGAANTILQVVAGAPAWVSATAAGLATLALDNLASVAINASLISDTDNTYDLGSTAIKWREIFTYLLTLKERAAPSTPASGDHVVYADTDGNTVSKNDAGRASILSQYQATATPSSAANVDFTGIPATGKDLVISGILRPATDDVALFLRLNGYSGASDYGWQVQGKDASTDSADSEVQLVSGVTANAAVGNGVSEGVTFEIIIPSYASAIGSLRKGIVAKMGWIAADGSNGQASCGGCLFKTEAISQVTLLFETGNIADGEVNIFLR